MSLSARAGLATRSTWWLLRDLVTGKADQTRLVGRARQILRSAGVDRSGPAYIDADCFLGRLREELDPDSPLQYRAPGTANPAVPGGTRRIDAGGVPVPDWGDEAAAGSAADFVELRVARMKALARSLRREPDRAALWALLGYGREGETLRQGTADLIREADLQAQGSRS
jgi:hypothetical protein